MVMMSEALYQQRSRLHGRGATRVCYHPCPRHKPCQVCAVHLPSDGEMHTAGVLWRSEAGAGRGAAPAAMAGESCIWSVPRCFAYPHTLWRCGKQSQFACDNCPIWGTTSLLRTAMRSVSCCAACLSTEIAVAAQESNHAGFPEDHQHAVRALLLCHHHLQSGGGRSPVVPDSDSTSSGHMFRRSTRLLQRVRS